MDRTCRAAETIADARRRRAPLPSLESDLRPADVSEGYRIQEAVHGLLAADFGPLVGYKIGCTSQVMQDYLSVPHPCGGGIFERGVHASGVSLSFDRYVRVGIECEIAVRMGRDLVPSGREFTARSVAEAVETLFPAIEIVDDRYVEWEAMGAPTLVADDFFAAGIVLGAPVPAAGIDLLGVEGRALVNGVEVGRGTGADVLGHPYDALAWLANNLASRGRPLEKGRIVMTGSVIKTVWLNKGDEVRMEFTQLGSVEAAFR